MNTFGLSCCVQDAHCKHVRSATRPIVFLRGQQQRHKRGRTREHANRENSEHLGARQVTTECRGQAPMWCTFFKNWVHACGATTKTRALVNVPVKKLMVVDDVGLLFSAHCFSYLLDALDKQTQWRRNKRKRRMLCNQVSKTAATGLSSNNVFSSRHVKHPPCYRTLCLSFHKSITELFFGS